MSPKRTKARLQQLATDLQTAAPAPEAPAPPAAASARAPQPPNPARGQRGDFQKVTITLPMDMLRDLRLLGLARRAEGAKSTGVSELVREAVHDLLERALHAMDDVRKVKSQLSGAKSNIDKAYEVVEEITGRVRGHLTEIDGLVLARDGGEAPPERPADQLEL
jgi:hypothetical protein